IIGTPRGYFGAHFAGEGPPRVFALHPLALSGAVWCGAGAAGRMGLMGLDARGHGASGWDGKPFTVEDMADDAAAVIEATASGPVGLIGLSMGGSTALVLAARRPDLISRVVIADASAQLRTGSRRAVGGTSGVGGVQAARAAARIPG
ncbi:MAG: alpha/beta fold hydrolase, partial [Trebonia sp.]